MLFESFAKVINDDRINEIVIVDDDSEEPIWQSLSIMLENIPKIKLFRNKYNMDCYRNKREAVSKASNECVILLDSDNIIDTDYLDSITLNLPKDSSKCIFQPSFAKPHFNFSEWEGIIFSKYNIAQYVVYPTFQTMLNACNYFVNRDEYLRTWDGSVDPVTSDSIYFMLKWFEAGNYMYVVPGMEYEHRVHDGSHYRNNVRRTSIGFHESILERLKKLK